jgi:penicillin amidase
VPGWTGEHEWDGDVPFEDLPRLRDPDTGFIVTANNRVCTEDSGYYLGMDYGAPYRARRVLARVAELDQATADDMAAVHADRLALAAPVFIDRLRNVETRRAAHAKEALLGWDGVMDPHSVGATIYAVAREQLAEIICEREPIQAVVPVAFPEDPLPVPTRTRIRAALPRLLEQNERSVIGSNDWDELLGVALERAVDWLEQKLGPDIADWRWERIHVTGARHTVARALPAAPGELDLPVVSCGGDGETVQATGWESGLGVQHTSVARYVFDLGDWDRSAWAVPGGSSGHPASPHYADQLETWARVELYPMTYSWDTLEAEAEIRQSLEPAR